MENARARLATLEADYLAGKNDDEGQEESYWRMHESLSGKVKVQGKYEEARVNPALKATGRLYKDVWAGKNQEDRRRFLQGYGVTLWVWRDGLPNMSRGNRDGAVLDMGDINRDRRGAEADQADGVWLELARLERPAALGLTPPPSGPRRPRDAG